MDGWGQITSGQLFLALGASVFPDWDFAPYFLLGKRLPKLYSHRQIAHYPLLYAGLLTGAWLYLPMGIWQLLPESTFAIISWEIFSHFLADTIESVRDTNYVGWGIAWLYPFDYKRIHAVDFNGYRLKISKKGFVPSWWREMKNREATSTVSQAMMKRVLYKLFRLSKEQLAEALAFTIASFVLMIV